MMNMETTGAYQSKKEAEKNVLEFKIRGTKEGGGLEKEVENLRNRIAAISNDKPRTSLQIQLQIRINELRKLEDELEQLKRQIEKAENSNNTVH